jgi:hypothetical protein
MSGLFEPVSPRVALSRPESTDAIPGAVRRASRQTRGASNTLENVIDRIQKFATGPLPPQLIPRERLNKVGVSLRLDNDRGGHDPPTILFPTSAQAVPILLPESSESQTPINRGPMPLRQRELVCGLCLDRIPQVLD